MPIQHVIDLDMADASTTGFASNVTGASFTLTATTASDGLAHQVSVLNDSATNHSGKTLTLVGTDADGRAQTETMAAPGSSATVESTKYFKTLTSVTPSATIGADTFDIGWVDEVASPTIMLNHHSSSNPLIQLDVTGTLSASVQVTLAPRANFGADQNALPWIATGDADLTNATADQLANLEAHATAARVIINSYSSGAELQVYVNEAQEV